MDPARTGGSANRARPALLLEWCRPGSGRARSAPQHRNGTQSPVSDTPLVSVRRVDPASPRSSLTKIVDEARPRLHALEQSTGLGLVDGTELVPPLADRNGGQPRHHQAQPSLRPHQAMNQPPVRFLAVPVRTPVAQRPSRRGCRGRATPTVHNYAELGAQLPVSGRRRRARPASRRTTRQPRRRLCPGAAARTPPARLARTLRQSAPRRAYLRSRGERTKPPHDRIGCREPSRSQRAPSSARPGRTAPATQYREPMRSPPVRRGLDDRHLHRASLAPALSRDLPRSSKSHAHFRPESGNDRTLGHRPDRG